MFDKWKRQLSLLNLVWAYRLFPKEAQVSDDEVLEAVDELTSELVAFAEQVENIANAKR